MVDMSEQSKAYKIPLTLVYGDLVPHIVALSCKKSRRYIFFDYHSNTRAYPILFVISTKYTAMCLKMSRDI